MDDGACGVCGREITAGRYLVINSRKMHLTCWVQEYLSRTAGGGGPAKAPPG